MIEYVVSRHEWVLHNIYPWQKTLWLNLCRQAETTQSSAVLLQGIAGLGKEQLARQWLQFLLCMDPQDAACCGLCSSCRLYQAGCHPDAHLLLAQQGETIGIDAMRELSRVLSLTPQQSKRKVALVSPAEAMSTMAAHALLKTLEEPMGRVVLVLVSHKPQRILPTVRSRCLVFTLCPQYNQQTKKWLSTQCYDQTVDPEALLDQADYAPLQALHLNALEHQQWQDVLCQRLCTIPFDPLQTAAWYAPDQADLVIEQCYRWTLDLLRLYVCEESDRLWATKQREALQCLSARLNTVRLIKFSNQLQKLTQRWREIPNLNPTLVLERLMIMWQSILNEVKVQ